MPENLLSRRAFIRNTVRLAVAGALVPGTLAQVLPSIAPDAIAGGGAGPVILRDRRTGQVNPVTIQDLAGDPPVVVTAEWNYLPAVVYKVRRAALEGSSRALGYNTGQFAIAHPTEPGNAIMVYEGKCKHLGCTVGWNGALGTDYAEDGRPDGRILCPCHQGQYDIYNLARNVPGTPPPEPLHVVRFGVGPHRGDDGRTHSDVIIGVDRVDQGRPADPPPADQEGPGAAFALGSQAPEALG